MATRDVTQWETSICKVVSNDDEEEIIAVSYTHLTLPTKA